MNTFGVAYWLGEASNTFCVDYGQYCKGYYNCNTTPNEQLRSLYFWLGSDGE